MFIIVISSLCLYAFMCMYVCICVNICVSVCVCMCVCMCAYVSVGMRARASVYVDVCVSVFVYLHKYYILSLFHFVFMIYCIRTTNLTINCYILTLSLTYTPFYHVYLKSKDNINTK